MITPRSTEGVGSWNTPIDTFDVTVNKLHVRLHKIRCWLLLSLIVTLRMADGFNSSATWDHPELHTCQLPGCSRPIYIYMGFRYCSRTHGREHQRQLTMSGPVTRDVLSRSYRKRSSWWLRASRRPCGSPWGQINCLFRRLFYIHCVA